MKKYKVNYEGFYYVEANSAEEAKESIKDEAIYDEHKNTSVEEIDDFYVNLDCFYGGAKND